jgi:hypothetical protein
MPAWSLWVLLAVFGIMLLWLRLGTTPPAPKPAGEPGPAAAGGDRVVYYRTQDGKADYGFVFTRLAGGTYRIYIASQPGYGLMPCGVHASHRLLDGPRHYVCWTGVLRTEEQARQVAALWADKTQSYIRFGIPF